MRFFLIYLIALIPTGRDGAETSKADKVLISEVEFVDGLYKFDDRLVNGEIVDFYENETLKFRYGVLDGRLHGLATEYYSNGDVKSERHYNFNKLFGHFTEYFQNGDVKVQFKVGLNAYSSGEKVEQLKVASGKKRKLKTKSDGVIYFIDNEESLKTSEFISILKQSSYQIKTKEGKLIFQN